MRQIDEERLNIGYDKNNDYSDRIFWSIDGGGNWNNASFPGAMLMRPVVTSKMDYQLGIPSYEENVVDYDFTLYPNPTNHYFEIRTTFEGAAEVQVRDLNGRIVNQSVTSNKIDVSNFDSGIYLVTLIKEGVPLKTKKLVVQ